MDDRTEATKTKKRNNARPGGLRPRKQQLPKQSAEQQPHGAILGMVVNGRRKV